MDTAQPLTQSLYELAGGDASAVDRILPLVYTELRRLAGHYLRQERKGHTLQPTALVHEAYFKMVGNEQPEYQNRSHFLGIAAHAMRQILIDHARTRNAEKRGSGVAPYSLDETFDTPLERPSAFIQVEDALKTLEKRDARKAKLVEMRFFGGMTAEESAEVLGLPVQTVRGELRIAQAWLRRELDQTTATSRE